MLQLMVAFPMTCALAAVLSTFWPVSATQRTTEAVSGLGAIAGTAVLFAALTIDRILDAISNRSRLRRGQFR